MKGLTLILFIFCQIGFLYSQNVTIDYKTSDDNPTLGTPFYIQYEISSTINGSIYLTRNPSSAGINFTSAGQSSGSYTKIINGQMTSTNKYTLKYQCVPKKAGTFTINPISIKIGNETYESQAVSITIKAADPNAKKTAPQNANYFVKIEVSKSNVFLGEHALVTYKLYTHYSNISITNYDFPMANGLWKEELKTDAKGWPQTQETIGGKGYLVIPLKKEIVYPQKTGEVEIPAITIDLVIGGGFFSQGTKETLTSNSPILNVQPLPKEAPVSFENQVGKNYSLEMSYSTNQLKTGEALDVKIKIKGEGNLKKLNAPKLKFPTDFELFDAEIDESIKVAPSGTHGYKQFNYLVIPRHHGKYEIPEFQFTYFDLPSKSYKTLSFPAQELTIEKGDESTSAITNSNLASKEEVDLLNNEIRHIATKTELLNNGNSFFKSNTFWMGLSLPPVLFLAGFIFLGIKPKEKDQALIARKNASKNAFKTLADAENHLNNKNDLGFYEALHKGMLKYLANKFGVNTASFTKENIRTTLSNRQIDNTIIDPFMEIIDECEMARFAPITHQGAQQTMVKAKELIQNIDKNAK